MMKSVRSLTTTRPFATQTAYGFASGTLTWLSLYAHSPMLTGLLCYCMGCIAGLLVKQRKHSA